MNNEHHPRWLFIIYDSDGIPEQFDGNLNLGSDISDWIRREVTADEIEVNFSSEQSKSLKSDDEIESRAGPVDVLELNV